MAAEYVKDVLTRLPGCDLLERFEPHVVLLKVPKGANVEVDPEWWVLRDELPSPDLFGTLGRVAFDLNAAIAGTSQATDVAG